jgi:hypothetical protein
MSPPPSTPVQASTSSGTCLRLPFNMLNPRMLSSTRSYLTHVAIAAFTRSRTSITIVRSTDRSPLCHPPRTSFPSRPPFPRPRLKSHKTIIERVQISAQTRINRILQRSHDTDLFKEVPGPILKRRLHSTSVARHYEAAIFIDPRVTHFLAEVSELVEI